MVFKGQWSFRSVIFSETHCVDVIPNGKFLNENGDGVVDNCTILNLEATFISLDGAKCVTICSFLNSAKPIASQVVVKVNF
jgi:hypothetical protein